MEDLTDSEFVEAVSKTLDTLVEVIRSYKENFEKVLVDKSLPLDQRWQLFVKAPSAIKNHYSWAEHFDCLEDDKAGEFQEISWYDDFYADRYKTVHLSDVVHTIENRTEYSVNSAASSFFKLFDKYPEKIDELKEEILAENLGSFVMDW